MNGQSEEYIYIYIYISYNKIKPTSRGNLYRYLIVTRRKHLVLTAGGKTWWVKSVSGARRRECGLTKRILKKYRVSGVTGRGMCEPNRLWIA